MTTLRAALARRLAEAPIAPTDADPAARTDLLHETPAERVLMRHTLRIETSPFSILDASEADAIRVYLEAATAPARATATAATGAVSVPGATGAPSSPCPLRRPRWPAIW